VAELPLRDASQRPLTLARLRGRPLVVSFVYTGCFDACPLGTRQLARAVAEARAALGSDAFDVVSIGFNQPFDTPEAMGDFARRARIADPRWHFVSVDARDVPALAAAFGFSYRPTAAGFDHITQATLVDARGVVQAQVYGIDFELPQFVRPLKDLLAGQAAERISVEGLWERVRLYCTVYDPTSGRYRANYSLFVELFAGISVLGGLAWLLVREWRRRGAA
jgi:protein SCO1/2